MLHKLNQRGQSTVEYVLLVAAVIAVMIAFSTNKTGGLQGQLGNVLNVAANQINVVGGHIDTTLVTSLTGVANTPATYDTSARRVDMSNK